MLPFHAEKRFFGHSMNELDRAILGFTRSTAALPELLRCLGEGDFCF